MNRKVEIVLAFACVGQSIVHMLDVLAARPSALIIDFGGSPQLSMFIDIARVTMFLTIASFLLFKKKKGLIKTKEINKS